MPHLSEGSAPPSLRSNFAWTFAGNALLSASQWAVLSLIAKLGDQEMLGSYALAIALTTPVAMLSHLNLRAVLATDVVQRHPFGDYIAVRLRATGLGLLAIAVISVTAGSSSTLAAAIAVIGISLSTENVSDLYYGALQRRERMDQVAQSMILRGALSVIALGLVLWIARDLVAAVLALALVRILVLIAFDRPCGSHGEELRGSGAPARREIYRSALPLGVVLMLVSLNANLPRYAIEYRLGTAELGVFAAVASFITIGSSVMNAFGLTATPRLARYCSRREWAPFRQLAVRLAAVAFGLGVAGVLVAAAIGRTVLTLVFRPDYAGHGRLLVAVMAAAIPMYVAIAVGFLLTSVRSFSAQMPLLLLATTACALASWLLVPAMGLVGAAAALGVAGCAQAGGGALILRRRIRAMGDTA